MASRTSPLLQVRGIVALLAAGVLGLTGCQGGEPSGSGTPSIAGSTSGSPTSGSSTGSAGATPGLVDVGGGRQVFARCEGSGSPTVVLVSGQDMTSDAWRVAPDGDAGAVEVSDRAVFQQLARRTTVCAYDRGNTSWPDESKSTRAAQPVAAAAAVSDLHAWLQAAQIPGPYVLAGHSFGGMIAVLYAESYPNEVAGLVLVDPANRYLRDVVDATWWADIQEQRLAAVDPNGPELADFDASADEIVAAAPVPRVPAVVLTSDAMPPAMIDEKHFPAWKRAHDLLAEELGARHITRTDSGHNIQVEQPDLVTQQILDVMGQVPSLSATSSEQ